MKALTPKIEAAFGPFRKDTHLGAAPVEARYRMDIYDGLDTALPPICMD